MLSEIHIYAIGLGLALILYWSVPTDRPRLRQWVLLIASVVMVFLYAPGGVLVCAWLVAVPLAAVRVFAAMRSVWTFWLMAILALVPLVGLRLLTDQNPVYAFGTAFATVKALGLVILAYGGRFPVRAMDAALLIFFFPLFTIGPVERLRNFAAETFVTSISADDVIFALRRAAVGLFLIYFVCGDVLAPIRDVWLGRSAEALTTHSQAQAFALIWVSFLFTYLNFAGFSDIAVASSRVFGLKVVENFDRPLLAANPAEFWKRYHISMGDWINQFLYFPITVLIRHPAGAYIAVVIAFVLFGLWHAFTWNYFIWGLGNGCAVALCHLITRGGMALPGPPPVRIALKVIIAVISLSFVALMQTIGNLAGLEEVGILVGNLIGL